jgi:outer membrane protein assembly factor BamB
MSLIGGGGSGAGGAGNPVGANPAGIGTSINYIGNHAYAYSGTFQASTTVATALDFNTGREYIFGRVYLNGTIEMGSGSGEITTADILFNGETVARLKVDSAEEDQPVTAFNDLIVPAYTHVEIKIDSSANNSGRLATVVFTGRVYA